MRLERGYEVWIRSPERWESQELDFGVHWTLQKRGITLKFRVSWIEKTGELYAVSLCPKRNFYVVLGRFKTEQEVEKAMDGWAELMWQKDSLRKLAERLGVAG